MPSRANGPTAKLSGSSFGFAPLGASGGASFAGSAPGFSPSFFGDGVRLRGCFSSMRWTKTSPFFAYANVRPSSDHLSVRPFRSLASAMVTGSLAGRRHDAAARCPCR